MERVVIFGATLPATHFALEGFSPAFITFCRATIAASVAGTTLYFMPPYILDDDEAVLLAERAVAALDAALA